jgi:hypothetical protein
MRAKGKSNFDMTFQLGLRIKHNFLRKHWLFRKIHQRRRTETKIKRTLNRKRKNKHALREAHVELAASLLQFDTIIKNSLDVCKEDAL